MYLNLQPAANLWYHDHAMGITRLNAYAGLAALYIIRDQRDTGRANNPIGLPAEDFEIPLIIQDKSFKEDGSLFYDTEGITDVHPIWVPEFFGDTAVVNAQVTPYLEVEPRRYRFRFLNGSQARFYNMWLEGPQNIPLWVIGMEQSLLPAPAMLQKLLLAPGERADVIVDFTNIPLGTSFILKNDAQAPYPGPGDAPEIPELMRIDVVKKLSSRDKTKPPAALSLLTVRPLTPTPSAPMRQIILKETMVDTPNGERPTEVRLNQRYFFEPVEEKPIVGQTEIWQCINLTGDAHPMHMHLVKFQVYNRQAFNVDKYETDYLAWIAKGRTGAQPDVSKYLIGDPIPSSPEEKGWKDTVKAYPGQVTRVICTFDVPPGTELPADYVYHCHILEHEENEMMRPFQVVKPSKAAPANPNGPQFPVPPQK